MTALRISSFDRSFLDEWMKACIELAKKAKIRGDNPVGAIVIESKSKIILGQGIEANKTTEDITAHAEILAIKDALNKNTTTNLSNYILVTTHEPCFMCSYIIRQYKIGMVVFGLTVEAGGFSSSYPFLTDESIANWKSKPVVIGGIMQEECEKLTAI